MMDDVTVALSALLKRAYSYATKTLQAVGYSTAAIRTPAIFFLTVLVTVIFFPVVVSSWARGTARLYMTIHHF